jgi:hypothetical protein
VKIGRSIWKLGHELVGTGLIVQVNSQDLGWLTRGKVNGIVDGNFSAIGSY